MRTVRSIVKRHPLPIFFALAYALSWWSVPFDGTLFAFGPLLAAVGVAALVGGKAELAAWLRRCTQWRAAPGWYAIAVLLPLGINAAAAALAVLSGAPAPAAAQLARWPEMLVVFVLYLVAFGPLGEEPGWRGFAMPRLEAGRTALGASLILGVFVVAWHLPLVLIGHQPAIILVATFAAQIMYTWLSNYARGSVLIVMVAHAAQGACGDYFGPMFSGASAMLQIWMLVAVQVAVALVLATLSGTSLARRLSNHAQPAHIGTSL